MSEHFNDQIFHYVQRTDKTFKQYMADFLDDNLFTMLLGWDEDVAKALKPKDNHHWLYHYSQHPEMEGPTVVGISLLDAWRFPIPLPNLVVLLDQMKLPEWFLLKKMQRKLVEGAVCMCLTEDPERLDKFFKLSDSLRVKYVFSNGRYFLGVAQLLSA